MPATARDYCKGPRAFYKSFTTLISTNSIVALLFAGIPLYIMIGWATTDLTQLPYIGGFIYLLLVLIAIAWIIAGVCMWRIYPNMLSVSVFVYTSLAHWAFVSILMVLFYGWSFLPFQLFGRVMGALLPLIATLYVCGDALVEVRKRLFTTIANAQSTATAVEQSISTEHNAPPV
jgi:hypothetical protein